MLRKLFGRMSGTHFDIIKEIRDLEKQSGSEKYQIAAKMLVRDDKGGTVTFSRPNIKLENLSPALDKMGTLGGASDTVHAETAVTMGAPYTENADLYVTDPLCPNCMKNVIEAGYKRIFIDNRGFLKSWYHKRGPYFDRISLKMAEMAGLEVKVVSPDTRTLKDLIKTASKNTLSVQEHPPEIIKLQQMHPLDTLIDEAHDTFGPTPFALALGRDKSGQIVLIRVGEDYTPGINSDMTDILDEMQSYNKKNKYRLKNDPVTRLMMAASRHGISLRGAHMYCSHLPSARCQINAVGYGIENLEIAKIHDDTRVNDLEAACRLHTNNILKFHGPGLNLTDYQTKDITRHPGKG